MSDFQQLARFGLRDLYIKMTKVYSESFKSEITANENLIDWFMERWGEVIPGANIEDPLAIDQFINEQLPSPESGESETFESNAAVNKHLSKKYAFYGIEQPPEGFLDIDSGAGNWWDTATTIQNGYFIQTHIFNIEDIFTRPLKLQLGNLVINWDDPNTPLPESGPQNAKTSLYDITRERYLGSPNTADPGDAPDSQLTEADIIASNDAYFLILDEDNNSLYYKVDTVAQTAKLYVRVFFNIYGQELAAGIVDITGISEVRKVPSGIRKNFLIKNFMGAIKAYEKDFNENKKKKRNPEKQKKTIQSLNQVKQIINGIMKKKSLNNNSRIAFIFNEDYEFLVLLDGNNSPINSKPLKEFLRNNIKLNKLIANLNVLNCYFGGSAPEDEPATSTLQLEEKKYEHFVTDAPELSEKEKLASFVSQQNKMEFVGDIGVKLVIEEMKTNSVAGASVAGLYDKFFNKVDYLKLAESAVSSLAAQLPALDLKKTNFDSFINSLDMTELIDCVVEQAGTLVTPPSEQQEADIEGPPEPPIEHNFSRDLKLIIYGEFQYFYNIAKEYDSKTFNYPSSDELLPYEPDLEDEGWDINIYFPYISMIPQEQIEKIYDTITTNVPQYRNNPDLNATGFSNMHLTPGFQPKKFVTLLLRKHIIDYAKGLDEPIYNGLYNNLAAANAKLKQEDAGAESESGAGATDMSAINATALTNKAGLPAVPSFDWFSVRETTIDYSKFISDMINMAYDKALALILSLLINTILDGLGKISLGDLGIAGKIGAGLQAGVTSNDLVQNVLDSAGNGVNSPGELYSLANKKLFPDGDVGVQDILKNIASELNLSSQVNFLRYGADPASSDTTIVQNIFSGAGVTDLSTINELFLVLNSVIDDDILDAKINLAKTTLEEYMEICEDNDDLYKDNLKKLLGDEAAQKQIDNEKRQAKKKLEDLLALLDNNRLADLAPKLFCNNGSNDTPVFDNIYSPVTLDSQNKLVSSLLNSANTTFNNEIGSYIPIISSQVDQLSEALQNMIVNFKVGKKVVRPGEPEYYNFSIGDKYEYLLIVNNDIRRGNIAYDDIILQAPPESISITIIDKETKNSMFNPLKVSEYFDLEGSLENLFTDDSKSFFSNFKDNDASLSIMSILFGPEGEDITFKAFLDLFLVKYLYSFSIFVDTFFSSDFEQIPLKDFETDDGGLLCTPEILANYKLARHDLQCYVDRNESPDAHQIAKLTALYETLINTTMAEEMLELIFVMFQGGSFQYEDFEKRQFSQLVLSKIQDFFDNSATNIGNLQVSFKDDLRMIYKYDLIKNNDSAGLEVLNKKPPLDEEALNHKIISYFAKKYFNSILNKYRQRVELVVDIPVVSRESAQFIQSTTPQYDIYTEIFEQVKESGIMETLPEFLISKNREQLAPFGFVIQNFIDIRQKTSFPGDLLPTWTTYGVDYQEIQWPSYDYFILTPNHDGPSAYQDTYKQYLSDTFTTIEELWEYKKTFLRSQGKINLEDFEKYYKNAWNDLLVAKALGGLGGGSAWFDRIKQMDELFKEHGPKDYFKKASVGKRLCIALPATLAGFFQALITGESNAVILAMKLRDYYKKTVNPESEKELSQLSTEGIKYLLDEKLINYRIHDDDDDTGGTLMALVPILEEEEDVLDIVQGEWEKYAALPAAAKAIGITIDWHAQLYKRLSEGYANESLISEKVLSNTVSSVFKPEFFENTLPYILQSVLNKLYGDELNNLTSTTKNQIINSIHISKAAINKDWNTEVTVVSNDMEIEKINDEAKHQQSKEQEAAAAYAQAEYDKLEK